MKRLVAGIVLALVAAGCGGSSSAKKASTPAEQACVVLRNNANALDAAMHGTKLTPGATKALAKFSTAAEKAGWTADAAKLVQAYTTGNKSNGGDAAGKTIKASCVKLKFDPGKALAFVNGG